MLEKKDSDQAEAPNFFNPNLFINTHTNSPGHLDFNDDGIGYDKI